MEFQSEPFCWSQWSPPCLWTLGLLAHLSWVWGLRIPLPHHLSIIKRTSPVVTLWEFQTLPVLVTCIGSVLEVGLTPRVRAVIGDTLTLSVTSAFTHFSSRNFFYIIVQTDPAHSFSCIFQVYLSCFFPHSYCYSVYLSHPLFIFCYLVATNELKRKEWLLT